MNAIYSLVQTHLTLFIMVGSVAAAFVVLYGFVRRKRPRQKVSTTVRLRTEKEQANFNPVSTTYAPRQYRRCRNDR